MDPKYKLLSELGLSFIDRWLKKHPEWDKWLDGMAEKAAARVNEKTISLGLPIKIDGPKVKTWATRLTAGLFVVSLPLIARLQAAKNDEKAKDEFIKAREDALFKVIKKN